MRFVASVTVEILNLIHIPALQHGNVIEIGSGLLGVDEACSGVRSLQATLMASLFIGELYRCGAIRRVILLLAGLFVAVVTNICRTFFLGWSAARNGIGAVDQWHDPAGFTILTLCFILVWLLAELLSRDEPAPAMAAPDAAPLMLPPTLVTGLAVWFGMIFAGVELWFHDSRQIGTQWTLSAPAGAQPVVLEPAAVEMLQADHSVASSWRGADGSRWTMFFFEWRPGPSRSRILARMHRPEVCLPAAGLRRIADRGILNVEAQGLTLPFEASQFESASGQPIFVYFCPWQNRPGTSGRSEEFRDSAREASLRAVLRRERNLGQQVAQFVVTGYADPAKADAALQQQLGQLLQRTDQPTVPK
jgi:exosortase/archaeosortase family protein